MKSGDGTRWPLALVVVGLAGLALVASGSDLPVPVRAPVAATRRGRLWSGESLAVLEPPAPGRSLPPGPVAVATTAAAPTTVPPAGLSPAGAPRHATPAAAGARLSGAGVPAADRPRPEPNRSAPGGASPPAPGAVWPGDFPDPSILEADGMYYAYSTEVGATYVPVIRSVDLVHWQYVGDALPALPEWSDGFEVWAPDVVATPAGYVMFYATRDAKTGDQCISRAISALPQGPFVDTSVDPFVCQVGQGGDIDPDPFVDADGAQWLLWKSQGTIGGQPPRIWAQPVVGDWAALAGKAVPILAPSQPWEASVVEAPFMFRAAGRYFLLYSGNDWDSSRYAVGYAVCAAVVGPCVKPVSGPVLASHGLEEGPGSPAVFTDVLGRLRIAFAAWTAPKVGYPGGARSLHIGSLSVAGGRLSVQG